MTVLSKVNQTRYSIIVTYITVTEFNAMDAKLKSYDGTGDVKVFLEKVSLHSSLKSYNGEKAAQNLASKLEGRAFDVYMRLPAANKKSVEKIHAELLKEFEHGNQNREAAIFELNNRKRDKDESPQTFAFKLLELVKLAYPSFEDEARKTIAKDYFIRGIHPNMQIALKSIPDFATASIDKLAAETSRLQIAGINSFASTVSHQCMSVNNPSIDQIVSKVVQKLSMDIENTDGGQPVQASANFVGSQFRGRRNRGNYSYQSNQCGEKNYRRAPIGPRFNKSNRKCRSCQSTDHFVKDCPTRYCQACGNRGHDAWDRACENYQ